MSYMNIPVSVKITGNLFSMEVRYQYFWFKELPQDDKPVLQTQLNHVCGSKKKEKRIHCLSCTSFCVHKAKPQMSPEAELLAVDGNSPYIDTEDPWTMAEQIVNFLLHHFIFCMASSISSWLNLSR